MRDLTAAIRDQLKTDRPLTAAGACYLLRGLDLAPTFSEAETALDWLARNGHAEIKCTGEFGPEYVRPFVRHTCNPAKPGQPLPWGRKAAAGECARCDELRAGDAPREAPAAIRAGKARDDRGGYPTSAEIAAHFASDRHRTECKPVCTFGEW